MDLEVAHFQRKPFSSRGPQPRRGDTAGVKHVAAARSGCVDLGAMDPCWSLLIRIHSSQVELKWFYDVFYPDVLCKLCIVMSSIQECWAMLG